MKSLLSSVLMLGLLFTGSPSAGESPACAALPLHNTNDVEPIEDGWYSITGGDPYLVFRFPDLSFLDLAYINIHLEVRGTLSNHSYVEWFWASSRHGFSEAFKGFSILRTDLPSGVNQQVELGRFLRRYGANEDILNLLRFDLMPGFTGEFRLSLAHAVDPSSQNLKAIHPTFIGHHLFDSKLFKMSSGNILPDFFRRFFGDPWFAIPYLLTIAGAILLLVFCWRRLKSPEPVSQSK